MNISCSNLFHSLVQMCYDIIFSYTITYSFSPRRPLTFIVHNNYPTFLFILFTMWFSLKPYLCYIIQNLDWLQNYSFLFLGISLVLLSHQLLASWLLLNLPLLSLWKCVISVSVLQLYNSSAKRLMTNLLCPVLGANAETWRMIFLRIPFFFFKAICTQLQCLLTLFSISHNHQMSHGNVSLGV